MNLKFVLLILVYFGVSYPLTSQNKSNAVDSIETLIQLTDDVSKSIEERLNYGLRSIKYAKQIKNDSFELKAQSKLMNVYFDAEDFESYITTNHRIVDLSAKIKDSSRLGKAHFALGYAHQISQQVDSAYYNYSKAAQIFGALNNNEQLSYSLGNLSLIQNEGKDYFGAEENSVRALKAIEKSENTLDILDQKWILNTNLGNIAHALRNYDKAIEYHNKALIFAEEIGKSYDYKLYSLNNIAFAKRLQGNYEESKSIFANLIETKNLLKDNPSFYALVAENLAYSTYLTDNYNKNTINELFKMSYAICDSIEDDFTKTGTVISWAKFNKGIGEVERARTLAKEAYHLSKSSETNEILLESMLLLSELNDGSEGKAYLNEHIKLTDSLLQVERNVRNKFARIELETDRLEAENEQISRENLYLVILSVGLLLTAILIYVVISQRAKNRKLKLIQVQQKANEDIYNLMLQQQDKVEEARTVEKKRISEELHDGVLGRLFGTRLSLDSINFKDGKEAMLNRANYIGQLKSIEEDIRKISHELNTDFVSGTGFMDIVAELIENQTQAYRLKYDFNYTDDISWDLVSNKTKINLYRIIQESMQNIYKHANAKYIKISISLENNVICLDIIDDGKGFDTSKNRKGIGLKNMTSRVQDIGGKIEFKSQIGNGTTVNVKIPYIHQSA
ncbi:sensor histidine kinase [Winogradskyella sp. DF17]|uniref:histidine kinase n=1 Tax=Winogradskyella pelagia TaxID=2819984 RepID=A0ABS3SYN7_9FLAO|nr:sensor histidine kinase [Winogradskyella sp. DF17]MBO3115610.1 sensor histidine kinase [Winogradskyella sp. DF17]